MTLESWGLFGQVRRRPFTTSNKIIEAGHANRITTRRPRVSINASVTNLATLPPVSVFLNQQLIVAFVSSDPSLFRLDGSESVSLMASRVKADHGAEITHATNDALWKPARITLMAHRIPFRSFESTRFSISFGIAPDLTCRVTGSYYDSAASLSAVCRTIERVWGRTGLPFNTLETGAWVSFDSRIKRLRPMADHFFLSKGSATTSFVRFS